MSDRIQRAYATLGLPLGSSPRQLRKSYKALVKRWHPDRFSADPVGQSEAAQRMREINDAYRTIVHLSRPVLTVALEPEAAPAPASAGRVSSRLRREEIEDMVQAIGTEGPIDALFATLGRIFAVLSMAILVGLLPVSAWRLGVALSRQDLAYVWRERVALLTVAGFLFLVARYYERRQRSKTPGDVGEPWWWPARRTDRWRV